MAEAHEPEPRPEIESGSKPAESPLTIVRPLSPAHLSKDEILAQAAAIEKREEEEFVAEIQAVCKRRGFVLVPQLVFGPTGVMGSGVSAARPTRRGV